MHAANVGVNQETGTKYTVISYKLSHTCMVIKIVLPNHKFTARESAENYAKYLNSGIQSI